MLHKEVLRPRQRIGKKSVLLALLLTCWLASTTRPAFASGVFANTSYNAAMTLANGMVDTPMTVAFDGTNYWAVNGGTSNSVEEQEYAATGVSVGTFNPGMDFRSDFTVGSTLYAKTFSGNVVYRQTSPGVFSSYVTLSNTPPSQSGLIIYQNQYAVLNGTAGTVSFYNLSGAATTTLTLQGFGTLSGETNTYEIATDGTYLYTYDYSGNILSAWNSSGVRVGETTLNGVSGSTYGFSIANGMAWVYSSTSNAFTGFAAVGSASSSLALPEPTFAWLLLPSLGAGMLYRRRTGSDTRAH